MERATDNVVASPAGGPPPRSTAPLLMEGVVVGMVATLLAVVMVFLMVQALGVLSVTWPPPASGHVVVEAP